MADPMPKTNRPLSSETQKLLVASLSRILSGHSGRHTELRSKMEVIDIAYARYKQKRSKQQQDGIDDSMAILCEDEFAELRERFIDIDIPLLVSQVDTAVGYLADLYLSGYPLFPVVSEPADRKEAEYIEALIDKHAIVGKYPQELLKFFFDATKYNFAPLL